METSPCPFVYILSMAVLTLQWQGWVVAKKSILSTKPKAFTVWFFTESLLTSELENTADIMQGTHRSFLCECTREMWVSVTKQVDSPWKSVSKDLSQDVSLSQVLGPNVDSNNDKGIGGMFAGWIEIYKVVNMEDESRPQMI